jgi:hypothetical protein
MTKNLLSLAIVLMAASLGIADDADKDLKKLTGTWKRCRTSPTARPRRPRS